MAPQPDPSNVAGPATPGSEARAGKRSFLRLWFSCSRRYARANRTPDGCGYLGRCPACGKAVTFAIGPGGTEQRFFEVSCR